MKQVDITERARSVKDGDGNAVVQYERNHSLKRWVRLLGRRREVTVCRTTAKSLSSQNPNRKSAILDLTECRLLVLDRATNSRRPVRTPVLEPLTSGLVLVCSLQPRKRVVGQLNSRIVDKKSTDKKFDCNEQQTKPQKQRPIFIVITYHSTPSES